MPRKFKIKWSMGEVYGPDGKTQQGWIAFYKGYRLEVYKIPNEKGYEYRVINERTSKEFDSYFETYTGHHVLTSQEAKRWAKNTVDKSEKDFLR